jgi:hypothetical protein
MFVASGASAAHFSKVAGKFDCPDIANSLRCARFIETSLHAPFIRRQRSAELIVDLLNGQAYSFSDVDREDSAAKYYNALELSPDNRYVVIHCQFLEGDQFGLLDRKTGLFGTLDGYPVFSPDGRWLAVADGGENDAGVLQIFAVTDGTFSLAFSAAPDKWWPEQVRWRSSSQLGYERASVTDAPGVSVRAVQAEVVLDGGRWKIHGPAKAD